ncbi:S41 family peptidase [Pedobacter duraquae]|uniref:Peptidase S41-like protein n=1 Tax=Pedobacter duraquae TaxID=425511 RepID=A0A4R6IFX9_9SPHI|nr:S41 family peptidase [Pedobacter duraquae]TDO21263.1 peptidase S41-like protein [Pedobacter duraquae]
MKYLFSIIICFLLANCSLANAQIKGPDGLPNIKYPEMLKEYDTLVSYIKQISPVIYYNKEVRGIDFMQHAKQLKKRIKPNTTMGEYLQIIKKTLNAAQDGHTSQVNSTLLDIVKKYWIPAKLVTFDSASTANMYQYVKYLKEAYYAKPELNLIYTSGEYYNLLAFSYKGKNYPSSMKLLSCNGKNIHDFVKTLTELVSPLRWDRVRNRVYDENFYWPAEIYKNGVLNLVFLDKNNNRHQLNIGKQDTVTYLNKKNNEYGYFSQTDTVVTHYFEKSGIFYAKIPAMREELGDTIKRRLMAAFAQHKVKSIVIDIRGNGGGSDNTYSKFLSKIVQDTLKKKVVVARNFSPYIQAQYHINRDSVLKSNTYTFNPGVPTLKLQEMYYIKQDFNFVVPDSVTLPFEGKIYVLQDKFIYSSASNLSSLANNSEQLVSIGETPDLLGGLQASTLMMMLPYSKFIFRVEPQIDLTDIKTVDDIFQNHVEYPVQYSIGDLYLRSTTKEDIYGKDFLQKHDPMFAKVLELEKKD